MRRKTVKIIDFIKRKIPAQNRFFIPPFCRFIHALPIGFCSASAYDVLMAMTIS